MPKADDETVNNHNDDSKREFVSGLIEVSGNRIKLKINSEFLATSEAGFTGIISLDCGDDAANIDKMRAAAEYFADLAQDLRQAAKLYQPQTVTPVAVEAEPKNQQQQAEHLNMIHAILEQLPAAEKAIFQQFGFAERAKMYKMIDYETDPIKMQAIICTMINTISREKAEQA